METTNKETFDYLKEQLTEIKRNLLEEEKLKFPSHYALKNNAQRIVNLLENNELNIEEYKSWSYWKVMNLKIFISDLVGELYHDYDKRNARYRSKWLKEKTKITSIISDFIFKFSIKSTTE